MAQNVQTTVSPVITVSVASTMRSQDAHNHFLFFAVKVISCFLLFHGRVLIIAAALAVAECAGVIFIADYSRVAFSCIDAVLNSISAETA
jgi:hypothetical protein